jgi:hypothetical protein
MKSLAFLASVGLAAVAITSMGCSQDPPPEFKPGTGQVKAEIAYPAGPYGIGEGSIIANYQLIGYANAKVNNQTMQAIQLADFYNPHGKDPSYKPASPEEDDRLFPAGSQYTPGAPKPTVLLIDVASVWCNPCNYEAGNILPGLHKKYTPCGGEFLLQLADGPTPGTAALPKNLYNWTTKYKVDYPSSIDPSYKLMALFEADAFPANMIIDTTTMTIVKVIAGAASWGNCSMSGNECTSASQCPGDTCVQSDFWAAYEQHLDTTRAGCTLQ